LNEQNRIIIIESIGNPMMKAKYILLISLVFLSACSPSSVNTKNSFPTYLLMNAQDLPAHWKINSFTEMDVENAESYAIEFSKPISGTLPLLVQHQLSIYQTIDAAKQAYPAWENQRFPTEDWKAPDGVVFQPKDKNDLFRIACLNGKIDGQPRLFCSYLQQHNNLITLVNAQLDDQNLNVEQLVNALEILDIRLQQN
jgi:hypothetical protein